jgi:hypothetical protein
VFLILKKRELHVEELVLLVKHYYNVQVKEVEMGMARNKQGEASILYKAFAGKHRNLLYLVFPA